MTRKKSRPAYLHPDQVVQEFNFNIPEMLLNYMDHKRLKVFLHKGLACVNPECDREGTRLVMWYDYNRPKNQPPWKGLHIDILAGDTLMTVDHILPKSKGGRDTLENLNPMCSPCNSSKKDKFSFHCDVCGGDDFRVGRKGTAVCNGICYDFHLAFGHYPQTTIRN